MPLILTAAGALGVAPFAVMRWLVADWPIAIIDTIIVAAFVSLGVYIYRTRKVRVAGLLVAVLCVTGTLVTVQMRGPQQVYWAYPAMMACFYLVGPRGAIALTLTMAGGLLAQLLGNVEPLRLAAIQVTLVVTMAFAASFSVLNERQQQELLRLATRDPLTGVGNRRAFMSRLAHVMAAFQRNRVPSSLVMLDVDHFKRINDAHGHAAGDEVLKTIARRIESRIRVTDGLYRIGGEEFVVVIEGHGIETAAHIAEELRERIEAVDLVPGISVTVSVGAAEIRERESHEAWLRRADEAMYAAKRSGRNRVTVAG
ncbi:MAG TPA: GGDEF domain-containing protein [Gammaproteobacteria bacterium]